MFRKKGGKRLPLEHQPLQSSHATSDSQVLESKNDKHKSPKKKRTIQTTFIHRGYFSPFQWPKPTSQDRRMEEPKIVRITYTSHQSERIHANKIIKS